MCGPNHPIAEPLEPRRLLAATDPFTLVVMPDTQFYSESQPAIFTAQTRWIRDNAPVQNIRFVSHVGDLVQNPTVAAEWTRADQAMDLLDGATPYSAAIGNHDYDATNDHTRVSKYVQYFGPTRYAGRAWYGGASANKVNHFQMFDAGPWHFLHLTMQWEPTDADLAWAQGIVNAHPGLPVLLSTHAYLQAGGTRSTGAHAGGNSGEAMWQEFIRKNPRIFMVFNGHFPGEARLVSRNDQNQDVHQLLVDFQSRANGGDGFLRILRFDPGANRIDVKTYSPWLNQYETDADSQFSISINFASRFGDSARAPERIVVPAATPRRMPQSSDRASLFGRNIIKRSDLAEAMDWRQAARAA